MPFSNLKLNQAASEEGSSLALPPPSLANLLEEGGPRPCIMKSTIKPYNFVPTNTLSRHVFTSSYVVISTFRQLLTWHVHRFEKNSVFSMLWSNVAQFLTAGKEKGGEKGDKVHTGKEKGGEKGDKVRWIDLPQELWGEIGKRLPCQLDILCFRSVCKKWRSSLPFPSRFPLLVPPIPRDAGMGKVPCVITQVSTYRCTGVSGTLVFEEVDQGVKFHADNIYGTEVKSDKFDCPKKSFIKYWVHPYPRLSFVSKTYHLRIALPRFDSHKTMVPGEWDLLYNKYAKKMVIISSNAAFGVNPNYARASDLTVVALLSAGSKKGRLALLRLGGSPQNWVWDTDFCDKIFEGIDTYRGQLCTLDPLGRVFLMDYSSLHMTQLSPPCPIGCEMREMYLFVARGILYLADFSNSKRKYKLSLRHQKWLKVS